ncbi:MAG: hypothetical protein WCZ23_14790 [Rhodospirillaceae bacterium]
MYREEFLRAISLLAEAFEEVSKQGHPRPVLVGGAVVELHVGSAMASGDFDILYEMPEVLRETLGHHGFQPSLSNPHAAMMNLETGMAVEFVKGPLFDGRSDRSRLVLYMFENGSILVPPIEDMIADRMGQDTSAPRGVPMMREQAVALYKLAENLDLDYLDKRIRQESANEHKLATLREWADEAG